MGFLKGRAVSSTRELWEEEFELPEYYFKSRGPLFWAIKLKRSGPLLPTPAPHGTSTLSLGRRFGGARVHGLAPTGSCLPLSDSTCAGHMIPLGAETQPKLQPQASLALYSLWPTKQDK